jgi:hypothetical protein
MPAAYGYQNRVQETSVTSGTGPLTMLGAVTGYMAFATAFVTGQRVYYAITDGINWEVGIGTFTSPETLSRDYVISSFLASGPTLSQALISWGGGSLRVWCDLPAETIADKGLTVAMVNHLFSQ